MALISVQYISSVRIEVELYMGIVRDAYLGVIVHANQTTKYMQIKLQRIEEPIGNRKQF